MNRRIRNRTYGGVGAGAGNRPRLPDGIVGLWGADAWIADPA